MAKYLVIGGGLAGLSASAYLSNAGHEVELIEASPKFGGRSYSFYDNELRAYIDNGQHIFMGSYFHTIEYLKMINAEKLPVYQPHLRIMFLKRGGEEHLLDSRSSFYPLNLLRGLYHYSALQKENKLSILSLFSSLLFNKIKSSGDKTVLEWLNSKDQSDDSIKSLWEIIGIGALNTKLEVASANLYINLLKKIFLSGNKSSTIILPNVPLSKLFIDPAIKYLENRQVEYSFSERIVAIESSGKLINKVITTKRTISNFDELILAVPPHAISKIKSNDEILNQELINMEFSPIITIHFQSNNTIINEKFIGLINSKIHWVFNNGSHFSLVISAADDLVHLNNLELLNLAKTELEEYFPAIRPLEILSYNIIKEKRATLRSTIKNEKLRPKIKSKYSNLKFAGDWTNTKLPGTIEGAILSGKRSITKNY